MTQPKDITLYFNFRSPYCYLASKTFWPLLDNYHINLIWKPVGGWDLRSPPDRAKTKVPLVRQDIARWGKRLGIPVNPPPLETEPTAAGAASLYAQQQGKLREFIIEVMALEWAEGKNIAEANILQCAAQRSGLDPESVLAASVDENNLKTLQQNAEEAHSHGIMGVPTLVIDQDIFWGQDRFDFVAQHLQDLRLKKYS